MLKKALAFLLAAASLFAFAGCKNSAQSGEVKIENEDGANEVITCPNDNMFGLEKIAVFDDHVVVVFDKEICDDFEYDENDVSEYGDFTLERYLDEEEPGFRPWVKNLSYSGEKTYSSSIELKKGKYIVTASFDIEGAYKEDPDEDFEIYSVYIAGLDIEFREDTIELEYVARGNDIMWYYTQVFDRSEGTWGKVDERVVGCETQPYV